MSSIKITHESDGTHITLDKSNPKWNNLNSQLIGLSGSVVKNNSWIIPDTEKSNLRNILSTFSSDDDEDKKNDASDSEYSTDDDTDVVDASGKITHSEKMLESPVPLKNIKAPILSESPKHELKAGYKEIQKIESDDEDLSDNESPVEIEQEEEDPYDISADSRLKKLHKILKSKPFKFYLKNQLSKSEFDYVTSI